MNQFKTNIDYNSEINKFKNSIIYFDWNILTQLADFNSNSTNRIKAFKIILENYIDFEHSCFVYSDAHYRDILLGDKQKYEKKIQALNFISKGWKIIDSPQDINQLMLGNIENIEEDFNIYKENCSFSKTPLALPKETVDNFLTFASQNKFFSSETINSLKNILTNKDLPAGVTIMRIIKLLRNSNLLKDSEMQFPKLDRSALDNTTNLKYEINKAIEKSHFDMTLINNSWSQFSEIIKSFIPEFEIEIVRLSFLCDFLGLTSEKMNKPTSLDGMINDAKHLNYALKLPFFITEDKTLLTKAKFIAKYYNRQTHIMDINDFCKTVLSQAYKTGENANKKITVNIQENNSLLETFIL